MDTPERPAEDHLGRDARPSADTAREATTEPAGSADDRVYERSDLDEEHAALETEADALELEDVAVASIDDADDDTDDDADEADDDGSADDADANAAFADLPAPLAATFAARGFRALTPVQVAAVEALESGADLRITSQTGSGKTVALGIVMARALQAPAEERSGNAAAPCALVVAPTRELASQVREELEWLYAELDDARVECVTGGTSVLHERRRLSRGPRVLVGTPGRLVDHLTSRAVDLSRVREVVLDEADQMLDLGFRDELETILDATPAQRRTHMVSATFPPAVARLAERYQGDVRSVEGTQLGRANADIEHKGHAMNEGDRYGVLVNTLLLAEGSRVLVFVPTRADAARVAESLAKDGFGALALSGELQQAQRERTLAAFKNGTVSVLVATDVAARGLDVPDVSLVVHYAPPKEGEAYVHRAGRTGRAGKSGTSVLFAPFRKRRHVERLLDGEGIDIAWCDVPSAELVRSELEQRDARRLAEAADAEPKPDDLAVARELLEGREAERVVASLLERARVRRVREPFDVSGSAMRPRRERDDRDDRSSSNDRGPRDRRGAGDDRSRGDRRGPRPAEAGFTRFFVNWGFQYGATPGRLMAMICRRGGITNRDVGAIDMGPRGTTFEVADRVARDFEARSSEPDERDPRVKIRVDRGAPEGGGPRSDRGDRGGRPYHARPQHGGGGGHYAGNRRDGGSNDGVGGGYGARSHGARREGGGFGGRDRGPREHGYRDREQRGAGQGGYGQGGYGQRSYGSRDQGRGNHGSRDGGHRGYGSRDHGQRGYGSGGDHRDDRRRSGGNFGGGSGGERSDRGSGGGYGGGYRERRDGGDRPYRTGGRDDGRGHSRGDGRTDGPRGGRRDDDRRGRGDRPQRRRDAGSSSNRRDWR